MKALTIIFFTGIVFLNCKSQNVDSRSIQRATISKNDSSIWIVANMRLDHRIFGYEKPDTNSKKMFLLSIFTNDVKGNPFDCSFGAYYQTSDMIEKELKFVSKVGKFIKVALIRQQTVAPEVYFYFEKKWIKFEK